MPASTANAAATDDRFDEPATPGRNEAVSMEISGTVKTRREGPDVCGLDDETIADGSDLH